MSVLIEFSMFPMDRGESVGESVSGIIDMIRHQGHSYRLTAMGTIIETDNLEQALDLVRQAHAVLASQGSRRVYSCIKLDIRDGKADRLSGKIASIEARIGEVDT